MVSVELDRDHFRFIRECVNSLSPSPSPSRGGSLGTSEGKGTVPLSTWRGVRGEAFRFIKSCKQQFDFIFADPPYALKELSQLPDLILEKGLLKSGGIFVLEHGKDHDFSQHPHFIEHRQYGSVNFSLFKPSE